MSKFQKKPDPISERAKTLQSEIASIQSEIRKLEAAQPTERSPNPVLPEPRLAQPLDSRKATGGPRREEAAFEDVKSANLNISTSPESGDGHYNELGVRKYDLASAWARFKNQFRGPAASNSRLVSYLAAGSVRGLRPLRYEKRVARNRFVALFLVLIAILWGLIVALLQNF